MKKHRITIFFVCFFTIIGSILLGFFSYLKKNIHLDLAGYLYTFTGNVIGTGTDVLTNAFDNILPFIVVAIIGITLVVSFYKIVCKNLSLTITIRNKKNQRTYNIDGIGLILISILFLSFAFTAFTIRTIDKTYLVSEYLQRKKQKTMIYDEYYVFPDSEIVTANNTNNLVLIYLESMETGFMSKVNGGLMEYELIPNLTDLANDNINFSATDKVGGFNAPMGTTWTMGALFASESGLPFMFPVDGNSVKSDTPFAKKVITMGDILKQNNYNLEFLCGSDASFAGRDTFYKTHGNFEIFDYYTALEKKYTDDFVWWGFDDKLLYDIAKKELIKLSNLNQPFCLTMLTVDTHHVSGYFCDLCKNEYDNQYANVVACADRQINDFVNWMKEQDFYENTTIVIIGDHPTMDSTLISSDLEHSERADRRKNNSLSSLSNRFVYNCFINSRVTTSNNKNRQLNTLDMFPTILASMGFEIKGDRLGMGTNVFSNRKTIQEETSYDYLNEEFSKYSEFCEDHFY